MLNYLRCTAKFAITIASLNPAKSPDSLDNFLISLDLAGIFQHSQASTTILSTIHSRRKYFRPKSTHLLVKWRQRTLTTSLNGNWYL